MDSKRMNERGVASEFYERLRPTPIGVIGQVRQKCVFFTSEE